MSFSGEKRERQKNLIDLTLVVLIEFVLEDGKKTDGELGTYASETKRKGLRAVMAPIRT